MDDILDELSSLKASELRKVIAEARKLLARKPLYIREIVKATGGGRYTYLYATWQEEGRTRQKSLGRKVAETDDCVPTKHRADAAQPDSPAENEFARYGIYDPDSIAFLRSMLQQGYYIAN